MKNLILTILIGAFSLSLSAQEILYGNVEYDGFYNIKKGAYWNVRPEAKAVYLGNYPISVTVYQLTQDNFVRFAKDEHTSLTANYIVFPKGSKIYQKNGRYYAAKCGNEIIYFKPVNQVKIEIEEVIVKERYVPSESLMFKQESLNNNTGVVRSDNVYRGSYGNPNNNNFVIENGSVGYNAGWLWIAIPGSIFATYLLVDLASDGQLDWNFRRERIIISDDSNNDWRPETLSPNH